MIPAREQVAAAVRKAILSKELLPGEELTLESVADRLNVSVTPVREAFIFLKRDGLIDQRPNRGAIILGIDDKKIRDHYETRKLIETEIVRRACREGKDPKHIIDLYGKMHEAVIQEKLDDNVSYDQIFHYEIWSLCNNEKLRSIAAELWNYLPISDGDSELYRAHIIRSTKQHGIILQRLLEHDEETCAQMMAKHIDDCMTAALQLLQ